MPSFKLPIRVHAMDHGDLDTPTGTAYIASLANQRWEFGSKVLWEVVIIPGKGYFHLILRYHHSLLDGYSMLKLLDKISHPKLIDQIVKPKISAAKTTRFTSFPILLVKIPYDVALYFEAYLRTWITTEDIFTPTCTSTLTRTSTFAQSLSPLNLLQMKNSAKAESLSFTAFLFSSLTSSIRRLVLKRDGKVEGNILFHFPMPVPNHPAKLRNAGKHIICIGNFVPALKKIR